MKPIKTNRPQNGKYGNFWAKARKTPCCWIWEGALEVRSGKKGNLYGKAWFQGKVQTAHRVSWMLTNGDIPADKYVLHQCDIPLCINPYHLYLGNKRDNAEDVYDSKRVKRMHRNCN